MALKEKEQKTSNGKKVCTSKEKIKGNINKLQVTEVSQIFFMTVLVNKIKYSMQTTIKEETL